MAGQSLSGSWQFREVGSDEWLAAQVPGGVHTDLMAAGRITDPFFADEELRVQWVAERDWEYRRTFRLEAAVAAESRVELVFDGLDTLAEVSLNRETLGNVDNMFRTWRWDVTDRLRPGDNEIAVVFRSAVRRAAELDSIRPLDRPAETLPGGPYLRKAPYHFGWDWGPWLPNVGIWQEVRIEGHSIARIEDVRVGHTVGKTSAKILGEVSVQSEAGASGAATTALTATMRVRRPDGRVETSSAAVPAGTWTVGLSIEIAEAELWWPNGLGRQPLYGVEVELEAGDRRLDARSYKLGLRTLELRRDPDEWGESFTFVVNGVPIFAKGSNWIPADSFPARVTPAQVEMLLGAAAAANHNMIRVWGGGYYETEAFYDLCDRYGILVWQDFMFSCSVYPLTDPEFVANVKVEVREQVRRLRHRACLALWCGNNEMERGWTSWGWTRPENEDLREAYLEFFSTTLPAWVAAGDPATPYWPSSPSSGRPLQEPIGGSRGDEHEWKVWHALAPFSAYGHETYRFISEFGFESLPALATIAGFAPDPADWNLGSPLLDHHQRCPAGNARILYYMALQFRLPKDFTSLVYLSQVLHAEAMRVGVEHWRRDRARCGGALYWQLNDCWPVSSWAGIDYYGRWKALHYATRRFFDPILLTAEVEGDSISLAVTNDRAEPCLGEVRWSLERLDGAAVASGREPIEAAPVSTTPVCIVDAAAALTQLDSRRNTLLVAEMWPAGEATQPTSRSVTTFAPDKQLTLGRPNLAWSVSADLSRPGSRLAIAVLRSDTLARWLELSLDGADVIFDDNYFDLPAGREIQVGFELPEGWDLERTHDAMRIRSVVDTYM
ncbi:MAG TPA: glycoside hydrolase family 2 protein [Candidatus Limnocylindrales bacterium]